MKENNYTAFLKRINALDISATDFCLFFNRQSETWRKRGAAPEWAWDILISLEEFPGLLTYYQHLMALRKEREKHRVKNPQPPQLVGKGGFTRAKRRAAGQGCAASVESTEAAPGHFTEHLPVAGTP